jgi:hypothetical protein
MLWDCEFLLPSGRRFSPFVQAPWADDPTVDPTLPAHIRHLGGEFVCVPFGIGGAPKNLLPEWSSESWKRVNPVPHGHSSDLTWDLISADASQVALRLQYPADDDIDFLTRRLVVVTSRPALDLELTIHARRPTRQPVGLHPILRLPEWPAQLAIQASFEFGFTYPGYLPPGATRVAKGRRFARLDEIGGSAGDAVDYSLLPKESPTEELLMLCNVRSPVSVHYPNERAFFRLSWDTAVLPSCLLWPSDRAWVDPPSNGSFRGFGVEPIAAIFDAAREVALEENFINSCGVPTAVSIVPGHPLTIRYRLEAGDE